MNEISRRIVRKLEPDLPTGAAAAYMWMLLAVGAIISDLNLTEENYPNQMTNDLRWVRDSLTKISEQAEILRGR